MEHDAATENLLGLLASGLMMAVRQGRIELTRRLIASRVEFDSLEGPYQAEILSRAVQSGKIEMVDLVQRLGNHSEDWKIGYQYAAITAAKFRDREKGLLMFKYLLALLAISTCLKFEKMYCMHVPSPMTWA